MGFYQEHRRHRNGFPIENGSHDLAAAPFYLLLVVGHALSGCQHIVYDNDFLPFDIPRDTVVPFENTVFTALGLVQTVAWLEHIDIVQPRCQFRPVLADVPVEPLEPPGILELVAARHEHDMIGLTVCLQGSHARLEELDAVDFALLELIERLAERPLFIIEQTRVP